MMDYGLQNISLGSDLSSKADKDLSITGIWLRCNDKINRLKNLLKRDGHNYVGGEAMIDSFVDISNYGIIAMLVIRGKWKSPEVDYSYQKQISFSQFSMYTQCPHKWSLQYRDGHRKTEVSIHMTFGTAIHESLQLYLTTMYDESVAAADRIDLVEHFEETLRNQYRKDYEKNKKVHFSSSEEIREFFADGIEIINYFKKKKGIYFSKRGWHIIDCELPIQLTPNNAFRNVIYRGFLDVVLYHEPTNTIKIIDIKTSTRGWKDKDKADEIKNLQLVMYKKFLSEQYGFPIDNIQIEYFIVKRKIYEDGEYPEKRIQIHIPASGRNKLNKANTLLNEFIERAFTREGSYNMGKQLKNPSAWNCRFCPFNDQPELCNKNL
jgi:hypothetical protein